MIHESGTAEATLWEFVARTSPNGLLIVRSDGRILVVNRAIELQFGYDGAELIAQPIEVLIPEALHSFDLDARAESERDLAVSTMAPARYLSGIRKDGSLISVEIGLNSVQTDQGALVVASVIDVTERRRLEKLHAETLDDHAAFERLIAELSIQFIHLPPDLIDGAIEEAQRRVVEALDLDRSALWLQVNDKLVMTHSWTRPELVAAGVSVPANTPFPWMTARVLAGDIASFSALGEVPDETERANHERLGTKSSVLVPLSIDGRPDGGISFVAMRKEHDWSEAVLNRFRLVANIFANALARQRADAALRTALAEVSRLRDALQAENSYLRREVKERFGSSAIVGQSAPVRAALDQARQVAGTDSTVLLLGETGSGKELFATQIHELSSRRGHTMVRVNCAAIPATLLESELFGREKGAYTGALARQVGRFELADHSTLFLDEIGDLPLEVQVKLLRVLEEKHIERLGSPKPIRVDTRIIAATHRNLEQMIVAGTFREDLFYRLNVFPILVPALRERPGDIPLLVWRFVEEFSKNFGKRIEVIGDDNMSALQRYSWPGNIRELRNVVERAMILASGARLTIPVPKATAASGKAGTRLQDVETEHIRRVLEATGWRIRGADGAAERLGLRPTTLETRLAKLGIKRPKP